MYSSLNIYKAQLIRDSKLTEDTTKTAHGASSGTSTAHEGGATSSGTNTEHGGASSTGSAEHGEASSASHDTATSAANTTQSESTAAEVLAELPTAHHNAKRAVLMVSNAYVEQQELDYNPMEITKSMQENTISQEETLHQNIQWTMWCRYIAATVIATTMQVISSGSGNHDDAITSSSHLMRRSEPDTEGEGGSFASTVSLLENAFVYKIFLIFAGLILVINSMIKALNTKISGTFYFVII